MLLLFALVLFARVNGTVLLNIGSTRSQIALIVKPYFRKRFLDTRSFAALLPERGDAQYAKVKSGGDLQGRLATGNGKHHASGVDLLGLHLGNSAPATDGMSIDRADPDLLSCVVPEGLVYARAPDQVMGRSK